MAASKRRKTRRPSATRRAARAGRSAMRKVERMGAMADMPMRAGKKPGFAFTLILVGAVLAILTSFFLPLAGVFSNTSGRLWLAMICAFMITISLFSINSKKRMRVRGWSVIVLVFSLLGFLSVNGINFLSIGFAFAFIGSIFGIAHH